jgi:hypothetical protein
MTNLPSTPAVKRAPQSPQALAGELRLLATLEALILALLAAFLGRRRTAATWYALSPLDYVNDDEDLPFACLFPAHATTPSATPRDYRLPCHTHQGIEHPILWVIGPGPCRGMRPLPRPHLLPFPLTARAPPWHASRSPHGDKETERAAIPRSACPSPSLRLHGDRPSWALTPLRPGLTTHALIVPITKQIPA